MGLQSRLLSESGVDGDAGAISASRRKRLVEWAKRPVMGERGGVQAGG
jgi:hypothetical protein